MRCSAGTLDSRPFRAEFQEVPALRRNTAGEEACLAGAAEGASASGMPVSTEAASMRGLKDSLMAGVAGMSWEGGRFLRELEFCSCEREWRDYEASYVEPVDSIM